MRTTARLPISVIAHGHILAHIATSFNPREHNPCAYVWIYAYANTISNGGAYHHVITIVDCELTFYLLVPDIIHHISVSEAIPPV